RLNRRGGTARPGRCRLRRAAPAGPGPAAGPAHHDRHPRPDGRRRGHASPPGRGRAMSFERVAIVGLGLIGGSIGLAVREHLPGVTPRGYDLDPAVRRRAAERRLADEICETAEEAAADADLVILCVPVGAMGDASAAVLPALKADAVVSDVGPSKQAIGEALSAAQPGHAVIA